MSTNQIIIDKAYTLFVQLGTQAVSTQDIATLCGISKATLFRMFKSKHILIKNVVEGQVVHSEQLLERCNVIKDPIVQIRYLLDCSYELTYLFPSVFYCSLKRYDHEAFSLLKQFIEIKLVNAMKMVIEKGKNEHVFKPELNALVISELYLWQIQSAIGENGLPRAIQKEFLWYLSSFFLTGILIDPAALDEYDLYFSMGKL
jgi:AcrR family transcriptional regulator